MQKQTYQVGVYNKKQEDILKAFIRVRLVKMVGDWYVISSPFTDKVLCVYADVKSSNLVSNVLYRLLEKETDTEARLHYSEVKRTGYVVEKES